MISATGASKKRSASHLHKVGYTRVVRLNGFVLRLKIYRYEVFIQVDSLFRHVDCRVS